MRKKGKVLENKAERGRTYRRFLPPPPTLDSSSSRSICPRPSRRQPSRKALDPWSVRSGSMVVWCGGRGRGGTAAKKRCKWWCTDSRVYIASERERKGMEHGCWTLRWWPRRETSKSAPIECGVSSISDRALLQLENSKGMLPRLSLSHHRCACRTRESE